MYWYFVPSGKLAACTVVPINQVWISTVGSSEPYPPVEKALVFPKKSASVYFSLSRPQTVIVSGLSAPWGTIAPVFPEILSLTLTPSLFLTPAGNVEVHEAACVSSAPGVR